MVGKTTFITELKKRIPVVVYNDYDLNSYIDLSLPYPYFFARLRLQKEFTKYDSDAIIIVDRWHITQYVFDFFGQPQLLREMMSKYGMVIPSKCYLLLEREYVINERFKNRKKIDKEFVLKMPMKEQIHRYNVAATLFEVQKISSRTNIDKVLEELTEL